MTRYKCLGCGTRLESPSSMAGQGDKCPVCGRVCTVPASLRKMPLIAGACALLVLAFVVVCVYWGGGHRTTEPPPISSGNTASGQSTTRASKQPLTFEYLEDPIRRADTGGYNAHVLIKPMTRRQLEALGQILIAKMHRLRATHLKACIYYDRADYEIRKEAIWMNAVGPDYKLHMVGSVPKAGTPQGLFDAYVAFHPMTGTCRGKELASYEYDPTTATLVCHEGRIEGFGRRVHIPSIVAGMTTWYLPPDMASPCWASLPGLKRVVVHFYQKSTTEPVATVSFGRNAFVQSLHLRRAMYDKECEFEDIVYEAQKRRRAKVMSDDEYFAIADAAARQIYKLYENLWVELSGTVNIQLHRELPEAPAEFYRRYYFGGD